ncbi:MAG TPA: DNA repair protein RadC [Firmicutes bacterium]|nr:DNA repair protein RadC [Candidatus Fermentithermobacillaceae bacterium]
MTIKDWPEHEKPRERLFRLGPGALSDAEILAILLGTGNSKETALDVAKSLLCWGEVHYGPGLKFLKEASIEEIMSLSGIGPVKAARLKAALEVTRRLNRDGDTVEKTVQVRHGKDVYQFMRSEMEDLDREHFYILMLNVRNQVTCKELISVGSLDTSIVHPREIFKNCIKKSAAGVILVHNHPSGDATPSDDDLKITKRLVDAGKILGIYVLDHVVIGRGQYVSMREACSGWFTW